MRLLILSLLLLSSVLAFADNKEGGNGQLVVIPAGHTKPVPYEAVRAWETGKYRNFFKLPCMDGVVENRPQFNRDYACHALKWLELVKEVAPGLYNSLSKAAETTHFNIVNHYILWEHKPYPDGELDYKKFEKAAFFNGEIILSTLVMDRVGPLANVLTKEQNQGYILLHELINAVYPNHDVKWKLDLGEVFLQQVIFKQSKAEVLLNLALIDLSYLYGEKDYVLLTEVLNELRTVRPNYHDMGRLNSMLFLIKNYLNTGLSYKDAFVAYLTVSKVKNFEDYKKYHSIFTGASSHVGSFIKKEREEILNLDFFKTMAQKFNFHTCAFKDLEYGSWDIVEPICQEEQKKIILKSIDSYFTKLSEESTQDYGKEAILFLIQMVRDQNGKADYDIRQILNSLVKRVAPRNDLSQFADMSWESYDCESFVKANKQEIVDFIKQTFVRLFPTKGFDFDLTLQLIIWRTTYAYNAKNELVGKPPFNVGDNFYIPEINARFLVKSIDVNKKGIYKIIFKRPGQKRTYNFSDYSDFDKAIILKVKKKGK